MQHLLQQPGDRGYPAEYLLTRIRGRRSRLISDWRPLVFEAAAQDFLSSGRYQGFVRERSAEGIWRNLLREYRWVYTQMNGKLRELFAPYFLYNELRTLFICLRHVREKHAGRAADLLELSLLSDAIKRVLTLSPDAAAAVGGIEQAFRSLSDRFSGLTKSLDEGGLRAVEQKLTNTYLSIVMDARLHPIMKSFFARLIDSRNILSMYKSMRQEQGRHPAFLPGGAMTEVRLREIIAKEDLFGICSLVREFSGIKIDTPDPTKVEIALYKGITRYLKKEGREPFGIGPILDYLWRCSLEVTNLSILFAGKDIERDLVTAELVQ